MKVVFFEEVEGTAQVGEVKEVKNGFARNYLLPRGLAGAPTQNNLKRAEGLAQADAIRQEKLDGAAAPIRDRIADAELVFQARVGEQGRLFGSITARDIAGRLTEMAGGEVDHRQVLLAQSLRTLGTETVRIRLTRNILCDVQVVVEADAESADLSIEEAVAEAEAAEAEEAGASEEGEASAVGSESGGR